MKEGGGRNSEAESDKAKKIEKILYKNQKRRTRNRLIYIVGLHVLMIFSFVAFLCA